MIALLLDILLGEPKRWHPLVGFGVLANVIERTLNRSSFPTYVQLLLGTFCWLILVLGITLILIILHAHIAQWFDDSWFDKSWAVTIILDAIIVYLAIGYTSLRQHSIAIAKPLMENDLCNARKKVAYIVSRDTASLDAENIRKATIESVLENGSDAIFAPLFWFVVGGVPAIILYRLANTLDAMWGYKTVRFLFFGRFSARMDDVLNWLPSRLVAISYALLGRTQLAIHCWRQQAHLLESPNGGVVMSSGAGALNIMLGGAAVYHGELKQKISFGCGNTVETNDIYRALRLIDKTVLLWCAVFFLIAWLA